MNARVATSSEINIGTQLSDQLSTLSTLKLDYSVDTFDADNTTLTGGSNALNITVSYIENTSARGVLVVLLHIRDGGDVDLSLSVYRVVEHV